VSDLEILCVAIWSGDRSGISCACVTVGLGRWSGADSVVELSGCHEQERGGEDSQLIEICCCSFCIL
jgi:hypothetical protein